MESTTHNPQWETNAIYPLFGEVPEYKLNFGLNPNLDHSLPKIEAKKGPSLAEKREFAKNSFVVEQKRVNIETRAQVEALFADYNDRATQDFEHYLKDTPKPAQVEQPENFSKAVDASESKWAEYKAKPVAPKKSLFTSMSEALFGKKTVKPSEEARNIGRLTEANTERLNDKEKNMPSWAQNALARAKEVDQKALSDLHVKRTDFTENAPSFMKPQEEQKPKQGKLAKLASWVKSWF